jgi:hypothetical protein
LRSLLDEERDLEEDIWIYRSSAVRLQNLAVVDIGPVSYWADVD